jgi:glycosyltransferase involved in cell wall biosynthesis
MPDPDLAVAVAVSVVVPVRNGASTIEEQLGALMRQRVAFAWEVIVSDNGSTDGTGAIVERWAERHPRIRLVDAGEQAGISVARNAGIRASHAPLILLCDADDRVGDGWLDAMTQALRGGADVVGGRIDEVTLNDERVRTLRPPVDHAQLAVSAGFLPRPVSCNAGLRRDVWTALGGFDEAWIRGGTETEFFWRAQLAGYRASFVADAVVHYRFPRSARGIARQTATFGRAQARLYRTFRGNGMPRAAASVALKAWVRLAMSAPLVPWSDLARQGAWLRGVALRWGRLRGSIRYRVLYL